MLEEVKAVRYAFRPLHIPIAVAPGIPQEHLERRIKHYRHFGFAGLQGIPRRFADDAENRRHLLQPNRRALMR